MDMIKILGSLLASGALSKGSGGDVLGSLIGAAMGGSQNQQTQGGGALGDILGSLIGAGKTSTTNGGSLGDILGSLIGTGQTPGGNTGGLGDILGSLVGGAAPTHQPSSQRVPANASDLEDLLGIGRNNNSGLGGAGGLGGLLGGALAKYSQHTNPNVPTPANDDYSVLPIGTDHKEAIDHATLIIRAMINAAKSDGTIDQEEQNKVIAKLGDVTQEEIDFVKNEFAAPLDVESFSRSIPKGMEEQIYTISLMAINLDKNAEAQYLADLAQGLKLSPQVVNQIHEKFGVPKIFA